MRVPERGLGLGSPKHHPGLGLCHLELWEIANSARDTQRETWGQLAVNQGGTAAYFPLIKLGRKSKRIIASTGDVDPDIRGFKKNTEERGASSHHRASSGTCMGRNCPYRPRRKLTRKAQRQHHAGEASFPPRPRVAPSNRISSSAPYTADLRFLNGAPGVVKKGGANSYGRFRGLGLGKNGADLTLQYPILQYNKKTCSESSTSILQSVTAPPAASYELSFHTAAAVGAALGTHAHSFPSRLLLAARHTG